MGQVVTEGTALPFFGPSKKSQFEIYKRVQQEQKRFRESMDKMLEESLPTQTGGMPAGEAVRILQLEEDSVEHINNVRYISSHFIVFHLTVKCTFFTALQFAGKEQYFQKSVKVYFRQIKRREIIRFTRTPRGNTFSIY